MDKAKWLIVSFVAVYLLLEGLLFGYRALSRRSREKRPPEVYTYRKPEQSRLGEDIDVLYTEVTAFPLALEEPRGIAVGPSNRVFVAGDSYVVELDARGAELSRIPLGGTPGCLAVDASGCIYIGMSDHIIRLEPDGTTNAWPQIGDRARITSLATDGANVFAADFGNRVVWRFDVEGRLLAKIGKRSKVRGTPGFVLPSPHFDLLTDDGGLWVANPGRQRVERYTYDGAFTSHWGKASVHVSGFCGCCNPTDIALIEDGSFVTSEKGLPRVKIHEPDGAYIGMVATTDQFDEDVVGLDLAVDADGRILVLDPKRKQVRVWEKKDP